MSIRHLLVANSQWARRSQQRLFTYNCTRRLPTSHCKQNVRNQHASARLVHRSKGVSSSVPFVMLGGGILLMASSLFLSRPDSSTHNHHVTRLDHAINEEEEEEAGESLTTLLNWSGTHAVSVPSNSYWEPESMSELETLVRYCHLNHLSIRPLGSALSPNAIGFHSRGMISMTHLDEIMHVDREKQTVKVQAGARVSQVVEALRPHGLTLPNLASIAEQQMGGFVQVGAHGTGAKIAPVDEYVTELTIVTPGLGTLVLNAEDHGELFQLAKVGLGALGIVAEVTMQCVPSHSLVEHTFVLTRQQAKDQCCELLKKHKHMRFMWIPYTDAVVCVTNDPEATLHKDVPRQWSAHSKEEQFRPLRELLLELDEVMTMESLEGMGFGELRDALLAIDPLNVDHVRRVNEAEANFWRLSEGYQTRPSDELLQFDCGGQQWVWEVAFPTGTYDTNDGTDMVFMEQLLKGIEETGIAAHSPIEQRWSASSSSLMSPAHGTTALHSWVGIIMYLPADNEGQRRVITDAFNGPYRTLLREIGRPVGMASHWAKLELPKSINGLTDLQQDLRGRYPVETFLQARALLDPNNICSNPLVNLAFGSSQHDALEKAKAKK